MQLDLIGIGALNFDYIHEYKPRLGTGVVRLQEAGQETLEMNHEELKSLIGTYSTHDEAYRPRLGGSSYLTVKTVGSLDLGLKTGFVGVLGAPEELEKNGGITKDFVSRELSHLASQEWLFQFPESPGRALVLKHRGKRQWIGISSGANDALWDKIREKENNSGELLEENLAGTKWVHITSLRDIKQFERIINKVKMAKRKNPNLKVSIDPGYEYTRRLGKWLADILPVADFIFLNQNEFDNLKGGPHFSLQSKIHLLKSLSGENTQVIVVKSKSKHQLIQFGNLGITERTYWHPKLSTRMIKDDTGAGDVLAAGVIAGIMTPRMLGHQPAPIRLGAQLARAKLCSHDFPTTTFAEVTNRFLRHGMQIEEHNNRQRIKIVLGSVRGLLFTFLVSFLAGIASGILIDRWLGSKKNNDYLEDTTETSENNAQSGVFNATSDDNQSIISKESRVDLNRKSSEKEMQ